MKNTLSEADFCIEINFEKGSGNPSRVFRSMTELIETFQFIDGTLVKSIYHRMESVLLLDDIQTGSLKSFFINVLKAADDDAIKKLDWRPIIGQYLVKAKYFIIDFLKEKETLKSGDEVLPLETKLLDLATKTDVLWLPAYAPVQRKSLIQGIQRLSSNVSYLHKKDRASYIADGERVDFNNDFSLPYESIDNLITAETIHSVNEVILKVKKPDYLGESMWEFRHGGKIIPAKLVDSEFLESFQSQKIDLRPGDSIRAIIKTANKYDYTGELIGTGIEIVEVKEVIRIRPPNQMLIDFKPGSNKG
jgi:hypothetical protein